MKKRGRPTAVYRTTWGDSIQGLCRRADGRWKVSATGKTFVEEDERLAVARFNMLTRPAAVELPVTDPIEPQQLHTVALPSVRELPPNVLGASVVDGKLTLVQSLPESALWAWMREKILRQPQLAAQMTGIEQLGYLAQVKRPGKATKLDQIGKLYADKPGLSPNERGRSVLFWDQFRRAVGVDTLRDVGHEAIRKYEAAVLGEALAPKSVKHRFGKIKTIIAYALKRGESAEDCRRALDCCAMLEVKDATTLDPHPITPDQFWAIHGAAAEAEDNVYAALLLMALNCCMYGSEVAGLLWTEIDLNAGEVVTKRKKTGVARVAVLWPETIASLKALPHDRDWIFNTRVRSYTIFSVLDKFRAYREAVGLGKDVTFSMIRDAAYTCACRAVTLDQARVLAGHRLPGAADHYVMRNPQFVAEACEAIRLHFFA